MMLLGGDAVDGGLDKAGDRGDVRLDESQPTELLVQCPERGKGLVCHRILSGVDLLPYLVGGVGYFVEQRSGKTFHFLIQPGFTYGVGIIVFGERRDLVKLPREGQP